MEKKKNPILLNLLIISFVLFISACSAGEGVSSNKGETKKLEFMTGTAVDTALYKKYEDLTRVFEEENEGVTIELVPTSTDHEGDVKTRLASQDPPDMWMTHGWSVGRYQEFLEPLTSQEWVSNLHPALEPVMFDGSGEIYAFPIDLDIAGIIYNADTLEKYGIDPSSLTTWDKFLEALHTLKNNDISPLAIPGKEAWPTGLLIDWIAPGLMIETAADTNVAEELLAGKFPEDEWATVLELVQKMEQDGLLNKDYSSATSDSVAQGLAQGQVGFSFMMNFVAVSALEYNPEANIQFMPIPTFLESDEPYFVSGEKNAIGVSKETPYKDVSLKYIDFLAKSENLSELASTVGSPAGLITVNSELGSLSSSYELTKDIKATPYFDRVYMPSGLWDPLVTSTDAVITKTMSVVEAVDQVKTQFDTLFGN